MTDRNMNQRTDQNTSTELVLVRHGESHCNVSGIAAGERSCTGLSPRGRQQAHLLAERLAGEHRRRPFHALYNSPRLRARETATVIGDELGLVPTVAEDLRHLDHGEADGRRWSEINATSAGPPQRYPDEPIAPGAESWSQFLARCTAALRRILDTHAGERILVVAHGETVEAAHILLLQLPAAVRSTVGFLSDNAAICRWRQRVDTAGRTWQLAAHNDTRHLVGAQL